MNNNLTPATGLKRQNRDSSDWQTYRRLLRYLKGTGWVIFALFACMVFEAAFTAASIGMIKPLVEFASGTTKEDIESGKHHPHDKAPAESTKAADNTKKPSALSSMAPQFYLDAKEYIRTTYNRELTRIQKEAEVSPHYRFRILLYIIGFMLLFGFLMVLASFGTGYLSSYLATKAVQRLRNHVFSHMVNLDLNYFVTHSTGSSMSLVIQDVQAVDGSLDVLFSSIIKNPIKMLVFITIMLIISPSLTFITFLIVPVIGSAIYIIGRRIRKVSRKVQRVKSILSSILEEAFTGMRVIKGYNMEQIEARRFEKKTRDVFRMGLKTTAAEEFGSGLTQFLGLFTVAVVVLVGAYYVIVLNKLDGADFIIFVSFLTQVFRPLKGASKVTSKIQKGLAGCDRVFTVLDTHPVIVDKPDAQPAKPLSSSLAFEDVTFSYVRAKQPALKHINFTIPAGTAVALVGETGSGKSTLANLIPRFYDPTEGRVLYDGQDLRDLQIKSIRSNLAIVTQEVVLFDDTVANNIAYGLQRPVEQEEIIEAAKAAKAHDFIMRMPQGYDTSVGARGTRLSGGERQRLAIARAILKNAPILILDEATSALDSETESLIQEALTNLIKGRTTIVIAHRLSTIQNCDRIYVLDQGEIIEQGTHTELIARDGRYAKFHRIQFSSPQG